MPPVPARRPNGHLRRGGDCRLAPQADEAGFALIEVVVALVVLLIVLVPTATTMVHALESGGNAKMSLIAATWASSDLDQISSEPWSTLAENGFGTTTQTVSDSGVHLTVTRTLSVSPAVTACSGQLGELTLTATDVVTWPDTKLGTPVHETIQIPVPADPYPSGDGALAITVDGVAGTGQSGVTMSITNSTSGYSQTFETPTTDTSGCVWVFVPAAAGYVVTLPSTSNPGYVSDTLDAAGAFDASPSSGSLTVQPGAEQSYTFYYDKAATVHLSYGSLPDGGQLAGGMQVSLGNTSISPNPWIAAVPGADGVVSSIYPYPSYRVWLGNCTDAEPTGQYQTGSSGTASYNVTGVAASLTPGGTTNVAIPTAPSTSAGSPSPAQSVGIEPFQMVFTAKAGTTLTSTQVASTSATSAACPGYSLGTTTSSTMSVGMPLGRFVLVATGQAQSGSQSVSESASTTVWFTPQGYEVLGGTGYSAPVSYGTPLAVTLS